MEEENFSSLMEEVESSVVDAIESSSTLSSLEVLPRMNDVGSLSIVDSCMNLDFNQTR